MWFNKFWRKTVCLRSDQKIVFINVISFRGCPFLYTRLKNVTCYVMGYGVRPSIRL